MTFKHSHNHLKKILFILRKRNYGYGPSFGLSNSCSFISNALSKHNIDSKIIEVIDGNGINREVHQYNPSIVILEAIWVTPDKIKELIELYNKKYKHIQWIIRVHSNAPFLSRESLALKWIREYHEISKKYKNLHIAANNIRLVEELQLSLDIECLYLPNIYCPPIYPHHKKKENDGYLDIACFGAIRELKNIFPQALAAVIYGNQTGQKIKFHINCDRIEEKNNAILKNLIALFHNTNHKLVTHNWMLHEKLIEYIQKHIQIGMAVSFTESYGITAYDYSSNDVPVVASKEIDAILSMFYADPTSYKSIVSRLELADNCRDRSISLWLNKYLLNKANKKSTKIWLNFLN